MKPNKAAGIDGILMEVWLYGKKAIKKGLTEVIKRVWKKCGVIPGEWKKSIIVIKVKYLFTKEEIRRKQETIEEYLYSVQHARYIRRY